MKFKQITVACYFDPNEGCRVSHLVAIDDKGRILERISGMELGLWSVVPVTRVEDEPEEPSAKR